jgi:hypothetical protein
MFLVLITVALQNIIYLISFGYFIIIIINIVIRVHLAGSHCVDGASVRLYCPQHNVMDSDSFNIKYLFLFSGNKQC